MADEHWQEHQCLCFIGLIVRLSPIRCGFQPTCCQDLSTAKQSVDRLICHLLGTRLAHSALFRLQCTCFVHRGTVSLTVHCFAHQSTVRGTLWCRLLNRAGNVLGNDLIALACRMNPIGVHPFRSGF